MKALAALVAVALVAVNGEELVRPQVTKNCALVNYFFCLFVQVTDNIKKQFVDAHNKYRGLVKDPFPKEMPAVVWDDIVAYKAQSYADGCVQSHSSSSYRQYNVNINNFFFTFSIIFFIRTGQR